MCSAILAYIVGVCLVTYALCAWFLTGFALHLVDILRTLGIKKEWWENYEEFEPCTKTDLDDYMQSVFAGRAPLWLELLCCPVCLSFHLSWMSALFLFTLPDVGAWIFLAALSWPAIALTIFTNIKSKL